METVALHRGLAGRARTVVETPRAHFRLLTKAAVYAAGVLALAPGDDIALDLLAHHLVRHGFRRTDLVYEVGDFAIRGGIVDLFPPGEPFPVRLDFFGDTLESIRWFEPQTQRSED